MQKYEQVWSNIKFEIWNHGQYLSACVSYRLHVVYFYEVLYTLHTTIFTPQPSKGFTYCLANTSVNYIFTLLDFCNFQV